MKAELIDVMGDDLRVANAARVSFDKESEWEERLVPVVEEEGTIHTGTHRRVTELSDKDVKLLNYLAKHDHWSPFSHVMITMRETVPIFVARQRFKHMVGFTYNEISRRYVDTPPEFYIPDEWRGRPVNAKQGSSDKEVLFLKNYDTDEVAREEDKVSFQYEDFLYEAENLYDKMIDAGIAPEQARMVLPQSMYTSYYTTGSLAAWARAYKLRSDEHSQKEIRDLAFQWNDIISNIPELKYSWAALTQ